MERVFFKQALKGITREWALAIEEAGELPEIIEHIHTPEGRFRASYDFMEFLKIAEGEPGEEFVKLLAHSLFPEGLRMGPTYPGNRKEKPAPRHLRSFLID